MDRNIYYTGQLPLASQFLQADKNAFAGLGAFAKALLGPATCAAGLDCTPTSPASLSVNVGPGTVYATASMDTVAYGELSTDSSSTVKQGIQTGTVSMALSAPTTAGYSINYLIQATFSEVDDTPVVLPYYNSANPAQSWLGPNNSGVAQNTRRAGKVVLQAKAGTAAATGSQTTPPPDAGYVGLWVVTVAYGATAIVSGNIAKYTNALFVPNLFTLAPAGSGGGYLPLAGGAMLGNLILNADPTTGLGAASKQYVDSAVANVNLSAYVPKAGGTMTGPLVLSADPSAALGAATKQYVDNGISGLSIASYLLKAGGTMTGPLILSGNPTSNLGAATKQYVDSILGTIDLSAYATDVELANALASYMPLAGGTLTGGGHISDPADPTLANHLVRKSYVDTGVATAINDTHLFASNGYQRLPSGLIIQWGIVTATVPGETPTAYSFPMTFPHACLNVTATGRYNGNLQDMFVGLSLDTAPTTSGFTVYAINPNSPYPSLPGFYWFAIGY